MVRRNRQIILLVVALVLILAIGFVLFVVFNGMSENGNGNNGSEDGKHYCPKERGSGICIELYKPVCGWNGPNIQCFRYPCAQTYSNECFACGDKNVEYWTEGECPKG